MKKLKRLLVLPVTILAVLASCNKNDSNIEPEEIPVGVPVAYILNQGNHYNLIEGSLNALNLATGTFQRDAFLNANLRYLGATPQCGVLYGSKLYIGVCDSHTIEVVDPKTFKSIKQISLDDRTDGRSPRSMIAHDGDIYVSLYEGYVARLDTVSLEIDATVKVGANPEKMAEYNGKLYVPNSEGMNYLEQKPYGKTASVVTFSPFEVEKTIEVPLNPTEFLSNGVELFLLAMGDYDAVESAVYKMKGNGDWVKVGAATCATLYYTNLFLVNNPYGGEPTFTLVNVSTLGKVEVKFPEAVCPAAIAIDPYTLAILIQTYRKPEGGFADYNGPSKLCVYNGNLQYVETFDIGVGPAAIITGLLK